MHLFDAAVNFCCSGIIAQGMGPAVGAAMAARLAGRDDVAVSFIGEGAANQGAFHEALNLAAVWKAPVVFVIEDNAWGISVAKRASTAVSDNSARAASYGIPGVHIPGNDPDLIWEEAGKAIDRARKGGGPTLVEIETVRLEGHFMGDAEGYRPAEEMAGLAQRDAILIYRARLEKEGVAQDVLDDLEHQARQEVTAAIAFARAGKAPTAAQALEKVFA